MSTPPPIDPNALKNAAGQPIGAPLAEWSGVERPPKTPMHGRFCRLEAVDPARHGDALYDAFRLDESDANWTYLAIGPFHEKAPFMDWLRAIEASDAAVFYVIIDNETDRPVGIASLMRIDPANGVIEVGNIHYSPLLQRRPGATEAMFLLMRRVFDELGYRRYEWKCDSLNGPSRAAAARLGFSYDGLFPQAVVYKGRNRDTTWFSILDGEWPALRSAYEAWLAPANFDGEGRQLQSLREKMAAAGVRGRD